MKLSEIRERAITPALALLPARMSGVEAEIMLLASGLQESNFTHRRQLVGSPSRPAGPAASFWQAEQGGGMVTGLLSYHDDRVRDLAVGLCAVRGVAPSARDVWNAIEHDDVLAAGLARLLLWTDRSALPEQHQVDLGWTIYLRQWRPGAYDRGTPEQRQALREKWGRAWAAAVREVIR